MREIGFTPVTEFFHPSLARDRGGGGRIDGAPMTT